jgi:hypothetical protein
MNQARDEAKNLDRAGTAIDQVADKDKLAPVV